MTTTFWDLNPSMNPRRGQPEQSTKAAPKSLLKGATNASEDAILRVLRSGRIAHSISELAREAGITEQSANRSVPLLQGRNLVRLASTITGSTYYEACGVY